MRAAPDAKRGNPSPDRPSLAASCHGRSAPDMSPDRAAATARDLAAWADRARGRLAQEIGKSRQRSGNTFDTYTGREILTFKHGEIDHPAFGLTQFSASLSSLADGLEGGGHG